MPRNSAAGTAEPLVSTLAPCLAGDTLLDSAYVSTSSPPRVRNLNSVLPGVNLSAEGSDQSPSSHDTEDNKRTRGQSVQMRATRK